MIPGKLSVLLLNFELQTFSSVRSITLRFPEEFTLDGTSSGNPSDSVMVFRDNFINPQQSETISFDAVNNQIVISDFQLKLSSFRMSFAVWLPPIPGKTSKMIISAFADPKQKQLLEMNADDVYLNLVDVSTFDRSDTASAIQIVTQNDKFDFTLEFYTPKPIPQNSLISVFDIFSTLTISSSTCAIDIYDEINNIYLPLTITNTSEKLKASIGPTSFSSNQLVRVRMKQCFIVPKFAQKIYIDSNIEDGTQTSFISQTLTLDFLAQGFTSFSTKSLASEQGENTVLYITFQHSSKIVESSSDRLVIYLKELGSTFVANMFSNFDLTSNPNSIYIPCTSSGIASVIKCRLTTLGQYAISIENFESVDANQVVTILMHSLVVPNGDFTVNLKLLNMATIGSLAKSFIIASSQTTLSISSASNVVTQLQSSNNPSLVYQANPIAYNSLFSLSFDINLDITLNTAHSLLLQFPTYGDGYILETYSSQISTTINGLDFVVKTLPTSDWLVIDVGTSSTYFLNTGTTNILKISNLIWPTGGSNSNSLMITILNASGVVVRKYKYAPMLVPSPQNFKTCDLSLSDTTKTAVNVNYTFSLTYPLNINENSTLEITFPQKYNLLKISPPVKALFVFNENIYGSYSVSDFKIAISQLPYISTSSTFQVSILGIVNPSSSINDAFLVEAKINQNSLVQTSKVFSIPLTDPVPPGQIILNTIDIFTKNENSITEYKFRISSNVTLAAGGIIAIDFPMQYLYLSPTPECEIFGTVNSLKSCSLWNKTINVEINENFNGGDLTIILKNITNPRVGLTNPFNIRFLFSGSILAYLNVTASQILFQLNNQVIQTNPPTNITLPPINVISIDPEPKLLYINNFYFSPNNEGEFAEYYFEIYINDWIRVNQEVIFMFPIFYDKLLGEDINFGPKTVIRGTPTLSVENRTVYLRNVKDVYTDSKNPLKVSIQGIRNPNRVKGSIEGRLDIAIRSTGSPIFSHQIREKIEIDSQKAPGWLELENIEMANTFCRYYNDIRFTFKLFTAVQTKANHASLFLTLPAKFVLQQNDTYTCALFYYGVSDNFYTPTCMVYGTKIWITFNEDLYLQGKFILIINSIYNLEDEDHVQEFVVSSFDGYRRSIIERSYYNLDNFQFDFEYSGPLIKIDEERMISTIQGTQTSNINISTDYPLALSLILKPILPFGFALSPSELIINKTERKWAMRISTANSVIPGDYVIMWEKLKDLIPGYYSPIKRTRVRTRYVKRNVIQMERILDLPLYGNNLDCKFYVTEAPSDNIEVQTRFKENYPGIAIENLNLAFSPGINDQYFSLFFTNVTAFLETGLSSIQLVHRLVGKSLSIYGMNYITSIVNIISQDVVPPAINKAKIKILTQHNATFSFEVSEPCDLFYMVTFAGTDRPTLEMLKNLGPAKSPSSGSQFGKIRFRTSLTLPLIISNLESSTEYEIHFTVLDRGLLTNSEILRLQFVTNSMFPHTNLNIYLTKPTISRIEKYQILSTVAFYLSLPIDHVTENLHRYGLNSTEIRDDLLNLLISPMKNSPDYPSPVVFTRRLDSFKVYRNIPYIDVSRTLYHKALSPLDINFIDSPEVIEENESSIVITLKLDLPGYVYAVAIPEEKYVGYAPNSAQIWKGLSPTNELYYRSSLEVFMNDTSYNLTISNLPSNQTFYIFAVPATGSESVPRLMDRDTVVELYASTAEPTLHIGLSSTSIHKALFNLLIVLLAFIN